MKPWHFHLLFLVCVLSLVSCKKGVETLQDPFNSVGATNPGGGEVDQNGGFYVEVVPENSVVTKVHTFDDFNAKCQIPAGTTTGTDMQCMVNIREQDLYFFGLKLKINVPRQMCRYFWELPYYYYNREAGYGPANITLNLLSPVADAPPVLTTCTVDGVAGTVSGNNCNFPDGDGYATSSAQVKCAYDYTDGDGPNCCAGSYSMIVNTTTITTETDGMGNTTTKVSTVSSSTAGGYGGKHGHCLAGPATTNEWPRSKSQMPMAQLYNILSSGFNTTYIVNSPFNMYGGSNNVFASNFFGWTAYKAGTHDALTRPKAIVPGVDLGGNAIGSANEAFIYRCEDESAEVKHRIRVYINEWDTNEAFTSYLSSSGNSGSPNAGTTDRDGVECDSGGSVYGLCDDFLDWDRLMSTFPQEVLR